MDEKARVRRQERLKADEQLSRASVRRFIAQMERPREHGGRFISIFDLMRDGTSLASDLRAIVEEPTESTHALKAAIDPYVQVIHGNERCAHTGFRLIDIWRYFRHTWVTQYTNTPGRTMLMLVRDRASESHPIIGIAALGSAIVQLRERDAWIGWTPERFLERATENPSLRLARWVDARLKQGLAELYLDDLIRDGLYWPSLWEDPTAEAIEALGGEATVARSRHHRFVRPSDFKSTNGTQDWRVRAESDLFRSKRCQALAELLRWRLVLKPFSEPRPSAQGLREALENTAARRAIEGIVRRAKADTVGTEIADLTVCGAIAPYNALLGGKLVSMLAVSPSVVRAYRKRYQNHPSEIASSLAGRAVHRRANLVFVGTTSLYGSGSSQYNRVRVPRDVLGGRADLAYRELGKSKSYGTSHLSDAAVTSLVRLAEQSRNGTRVNSIFGEGVNPKLRKVRAGLDLLDWPSDGLLRHRRPRLIYGVALAENLEDYLLGIDKQPRYLFGRSSRGDGAAIADWWRDRWLARRIKSDKVLSEVASHRNARPVRHGARVVLPDVSDESRV
jgi:hypothetical protein